MTPAARLGLTLAQLLLPIIDLGQSRAQEGKGIAVEKWMKCTITESPIPTHDRYFGFNEADKTVAESARGRPKSCRVLFITNEWINAWCYPETGGTDWIMIDRIESTISINKWPFVANSYRFKDAVGEDKGVCTQTSPPER